MPGLNSRILPLRRPNLQQQLEQKVPQGMKLGGSPHTDSSASLRLAQRRDPEFTDIIIALELLQQPPPTIGGRIL